MKLPDGAVQTSRIEIVGYMREDGSSDYASDVPDGQTNAETTVLLQFAQWSMIEDLVQQLLDERDG